LLRGFGFAVNETQIEIAQVGVSTSQESFRASVLDILLQTEGAYWDLTAAISSLDVQTQSFKLADDLLSLNRKKVEVGTLAPIQITEAQASVADREQGVILAQAAIRNAEDNLRRIMNLRPILPSGTWPSIRRTRPRSSPPTSTSRRWRRPRWTGAPRSSSPRTTSRPRTCATASTRTA
jgi:outer membrane protein TolC